jgi:hypothetical protein
MMIGRNSVKTYRSASLIFGFFIIANCALVNSTLLDVFKNTPAPILTPARLDAVIGQVDPVIPIDDSWLSYQNNELGISLKCPVRWQVIPLKEGSGVGLYPPGSNPNFPTPMIRIEWLNIAYTSGTPIMDTGSPITSIDVSGITGQQYQDSQFALPTQSYYVELPYRDGILFFIATMGPSVNLVPQFTEILKTITFLNG